jgi:hypothetical protein
MNDRTASWLWLGLGISALALLWIAVLLYPAWIRWVRVVYMSTPFVAAAVDLLPRWRKDAASAIAAVGLGVLFLMAWWI